MLTALLEDTRDQGGLSWAIELRPLPGLLFFYAVSMGALHSTHPDRYRLIARLFHRVETRHRREARAASRVLSPFDVLDTDALRGTAEFQRKIFAISRYLHARVRPTFQDMIRSEAGFTELFDRWEYLLSLTLMGTGNRYFGRYMEGGFLDESPLYKTLCAEFNDQGAAWGPVAGGLFTDEVARKGLPQLLESAQQLRWG